MITAVLPAIIPSKRSGFIRLEKHSHLYWFVTNVNKLLNFENCEKLLELDRTLKTSDILKRTLFPKIHDKLSMIDDYFNMAFWEQTFRLLNHLISVASSLIIDEMIDEGHFGSDWENFIVGTINGMTEKVFYNPDKILLMADTESPDAQRKFETLISFPVCEMYYNMYGDLETFC